MLKNIFMSAETYFQIYFLYFDFQCIWCFYSRCSSEHPKPIKRIKFTHLQNVKYSEIDLKEEKEWKRVFTVYLF